MNPFPPKTASLQVSTFRGTTPGATHYYGVIIDEQTFETFKVKQPLTMDMARELDRKDLTGGVYQDAVRQGDNPHTERFSTQIRLLNRARTVAKALKFDYLIHKPPGAPVLGRVLLAPSIVKIDAANDLVEQTKELAYGTAEYKSLFQKYLEILK